MVGMLEAVGGLGSFLVRGLSVIMVGGLLGLWRMAMCISTG